MPTENELTVSVPEAWRRLGGKSRGAAYEAAKRGDLPTIQLGPRLKRVPIRALERMLDKAGGE